MSDCARCKATAEGKSNLCFGCIRSLRTLLRTAHELAEELQIQVTRQTRGAPSVGRSNGERPLVFDDQASESDWILLSTLRKWSHRVGGPGLLFCTASVMFADWLGERVLALSELPDAIRAYVEIDTAVEAAARTVNPRPVSLYLGECECGRPLYAPSTQEIAICVCRAAYDVAASQAQNKDQARDLLVTSQQATAMGEIYGKPIKAATLRTWVRRGKLAPAHVADSGERLFRFGDILDCQHQGA